MKNKSGFTLIEILVIVAIVAILATAILVSVDRGRRNARINAVKTSLKTALPIMVSCLDSTGEVTGPNIANNGGNQICSMTSGSNWPVLAGGYKYVTISYNDSNSCNFTVSTNGDTSANLTCSCATQLCE